MIEAMKQALEALERSVATCFDQYAYQQVMSQPDHFIHQAITSLRQAIAEAEKQDKDCQRCGGKGCIACDAREQEPVAWWNDTGTHIDLNVSGRGKPLYTHPQPKREWVGLTGEQICDCWNLNGEQFYKNIEAKLKEKNT